MQALLTVESDVDEVALLGEETGEHRAEGAVILDDQQAVGHRPSVPRQFFEGAKKPMAAFLAWTHLAWGFRRAKVTSWVLVGVGIAGVGGASALAYADTVKPGGR